ncbi:MAG: squalene synthase HpnC [Burkholderiaceae bacterium]
MSVDHYENFPVASFLCPPALRPAVRAIYAFARTADDLADEGDLSDAQRLTELAAYRADLLAVCADTAPSPRWEAVFEPLRTVLASHRLPPRLLTDLLSAFEQDVVKHTYADRAELLDYCSRSADPVGRLMLHLYGVSDALALRQSDAICTALQLANFWQDLSIDTRRGRVYAPLTDCVRHGVEASQLLAQHDSPDVRALVSDLVGWARERMHFGAPLVHAVPGRAGWELRLVVQGGLRILERIEALGFGTLRTRPALDVRDAGALLWRALRMRVADRVVASESA